jgi:hypothetical protein
MLKQTKADYPPDLFFVETLGVPPPKTRPCQYTGDIMTIHPQSTALEKVIETILILKQIIQVWVDFTTIRSLYYKTFDGRN